MNTPRNTSEHENSRSVLVSMWWTALVLAGIAVIATNASDKVQETLDLKIEKPLTISDGKALSMQFRTGEYQVLLHENGTQVYYKGRRIY